MIHIKHVGIYVENLSKMTEFYKNSFGMKTICENVEDSSELIKQLFGAKTQVHITKLITERGAETKVGDMIELIQASSEFTRGTAAKKVYEAGNAHISLGITDIEAVTKHLIQQGGKKETDILVMGNGNRCCFCTDPEGNWIELIQNGVNK